MCNLYNVTTTRDAVLQFTKAFHDKAGWNEASFDVYPNTLAPIVRVGEDGQREIVRATWGMPTPPAYIKGNYDPGVISAMSTPHIGGAGLGRPAAAWCRSPPSPNPTRRARCRAEEFRTRGSPRTRIGR